MLVTVQRQVTETLEVNLPAFYKDGEKYYGFLSEKTMFTVYSSMGFFNLMVCEPTPTDVKSALSSTEITKEQFIEALQHVTCRFEDVLPELKQYA